MTTRLDPNVKLSPSYANPNSYLQKRRNAHRSMRRSEILDFVDAALNPPEDFPKQSLLNQAAEGIGTKNLRRLSQISIIDMSGIISDKRRYPNEEDNYLTDSTFEEDDSGEEENMTSPFNEVEEIESSTSEKERASIEFEKDIVFEREQGASSSSFLDDESDDFMNVLGDCGEEEAIEEELFCRTEEDIIYESDDTAPQSLLETMKEFKFGETDVFIESDQEETDFYETVEASAMLVTILEEETELDDGCSQEEVLHESNVGIDGSKHVKDEPCTERNSFITACDTLEARPELVEEDAIYVDLSLEEIIVNDDEVCSEAWEAFESPIEEFWVDSEQGKSDVCETSSEALVHEVSERSMEGCWEDSESQKAYQLQPPKVWEISAETIEHRNSESSMELFFEETKSVASDQVYEVEKCGGIPLNEKEDGNLTDTTDEDMSSHDGESHGWDGYLQNNLGVNYQEDERYKFLVPKIPILQQWERDNEKAQVQIVNQEVEENGFCKHIEAPEVAPRTPRNIVFAILAQGGLQFKLRKVPAEHKNKYQSIAQTASSLGRLTRLQEHVIESVSFDDESSKETEQSAPRKSPRANTRSSGQRLSVEAAALGKMIRLQEECFTNWDEDGEAGVSPCNETTFTKNTDFLERRISIDDARDDRGLLVHRSSLLIHHHVRDSLLAKMDKDWAMEHFLEDEEDSNNEAFLPKRSVPNFKLPKSEKQLSREEILESLAQGVAEKWWERRYRLERPGAQLRLHLECNCIYCKKTSHLQPQCYVAAHSSNHVDEERTPPSPLEQNRYPRRCAT